MSLILDALRRGQPKPDPEARESPQVTAYADAVLATLGYSRGEPPATLGTWLRAYGLWPVAVVLLGLVGWAAWWSATGNLGGLPAGADRVADARTPPPAVSRPGEQPVADAEIAVTPDEPVAATVPDLAPPPVTASRPAAQAEIAVTPDEPVAATAPDLTPPPVTASRPAAQSVPPAQPPNASVAAVTEPRPLPGGGPSTAPSAPPAPEPVVPVERPPVTQPDHFEVALSSQRAGDFESALLHYRALLESNEFNAKVHNNLGLLYHERGLTYEADRAFQRALAIDPRYAKAYNNLGVARLRQGRNDEAAAAFRTALRLDPTNVESLVNLALALKGAGRVEEARETFLQALAMNGSSAPGHYNLALLYEETGDISRAVDHFESFLEYGRVEHAQLATQVRDRLADLQNLPR